VLGLLAGAEELLGQLSHVTTPVALTLPYLLAGQAQSVIVVVVADVCLSMLLPVGHFLQTVDAATQAPLPVVFPVTSLPV
jgi:hypothetical protein